MSKEKCYKGFSKGLVCLDKQYKENTVFKENGEDICNPGVMHYCKDPVQVLKHYPFIDTNVDFNEYAEIKPLGEVELQLDYKFATNKLKVKKKMTFNEFLKTCVNFMINKFDTMTKSSDSNIISKATSEELSNLASTGNHSRLASSGFYARIATSGEYIKASTSGFGSIVISSGDCPQLATAGDDTQLAASGNYAQLASAGDSAIITSSGLHARLANAGSYSRLASLGDSSKLVSSGNYTKAASYGENSIVCCIGNGSMAKAKIGSFIVLAEWKQIDSQLVPINVKAVKVDGVKIKEDTFYVMKNGKIVEASI